MSEKIKFDKRNYRKHNDKNKNLINKSLKECGAGRSIVIDGGSGSTLIACEQLDRKCYMMELDPKYCDVILQRWENLTGKKAVLLNGEQ